MTEPNIITIIGGSGFVGRAVVRHLAKKGYYLRIVCRDPIAAEELRTAGNLGQIALMQGDITRPETLAPALRGACAVINLVGILYQRRNGRFMTVHNTAAEKLAQMARASGVRHFVQMSALGVDKAKGSKYAQSKLLGEKNVTAAFPGAVILRPSVIFGPEDDFFNQFGQMAMVSPVLPLIGGGTTKFQPVYVGDVAEAVARVIENPSARGQIYELGGPDIMTFRQVLEYILSKTGRKCCLMPLPSGLAKLVAPVVQHLPRPPFIGGKGPLFTSDQITLLKYDNIVGSQALTFRDLDIIPTAVDAVVPGYISRFARRGGKA